uniref:uncharacterized protein LOC120337903 isoform X2 n=1 Tax=Styela clava TaxID=7725 RepID=UPI00193A784B|nr:uncharacterized protein LOC120337903 isoform X2 [Styela clava]
MSHHFFSRERTLVGIVIFVFAIYIMYNTSWSSGLSFTTLHGEYPKNPTRKSKYRHPFCGNILYNLTNGRWIKQIYSVSENEEEYKKLLTQENKLDSHLSEFRIKRGIHTRLWRDDNKCGFNNCVDTRKIYHAEISDWFPFDSSCRRRNYTAAQACEVVNRFSQIYFLGDSFVRKMARGFVLTLRSDPTYGFLLERYDEKLTKLCVGVDQFYWTECKAGAGNILDMLVDKTSFCGIHTPFISVNEYYNHAFANDFLSLVKNLAGKVGSVLLVGQGGHDGCNSKVTINNFLGPAIKYLEDHYRDSHKNNTKFGKNFKVVRRWPHIIFMYPDSNGILKPKAYHAANGNIVCKQFSKEMKVYCDAHNIPVLDFYSLTSGVHSYDGAHHGLGANIMKVQLLLNYLDYIF